MDKQTDINEPSPASAGSQNTHMATARLSAANTWLQDEIRRLRLTAEEREAILAMACHCDTRCGPEWVKFSATLRSLLERTR